MLPHHPRHKRTNTGHAPRYNAGIDDQSQGTNAAEHLQGCARLPKRGEVVQYTGENLPSQFQDLECLGPSRERRLAGKEPPLPIEKVPKLLIVPKGIREAPSIVLSPEVKEGREVFGLKMGVAYEVWQWAEERNAEMTKMHDAAQLDATYRGYHIAMIDTAPTVGELNTLQPPIIMRGERKIPNPRHPYLMGRELAMVLRRTDAMRDPGLAWFDAQHNKLSPLYLGCPHGNSQDAYFKGIADDLAGEQQPTALNPLCKERLPGPTRESRRL